MDICGLSGSEADTVRRGIAKKKLDVLERMMPKIIDGYCSRSTKPKDVAAREVSEYLKVIEDASEYMFNYSHSIAYCLLGYYYGYFRYYYPLEFITSYLNNAANEEDIRVGTALAIRRGIKITMPKWGFSKSDYFFDREKRVIAKGLSSVKYMSAGVAEELYALSHSRAYTRFVDVLSDIDAKTSLNTRQLDILIKIDFFSDFGNQRELLRITELFYDTFKKGQAKKIIKDKIDGTPLEPIVSKYAVGVTRSGQFSKSYTLLDVGSILAEAEDAIKALHMEDLSDVIKVRNFADVMGYAGYVSGKEDDRPKLYVSDIYPLLRKKDGKQFGYSILTKSIGNGKESRFTVFNKIFDEAPIKSGDILLCRSYIREGKYFRLTSYQKL